MKKVKGLLVGMCLVFVASVASAGFMSEVGNMVKEDAKQAATQEVHKVVDKSMEKATGTVANATSEVNATDAMKKVEKAKEMKDKAVETKENAEKMHEIGKKEMEKWKGLGGHK